MTEKRKIGMIEITAHSGFSLNYLVETWSFMDSCRSDVRDGICNLLKQLTKSEHSLDSLKFWGVAKQDHVVTALAIDDSDPSTNKVIGMAMMFIHQKFSSVNGYIEDVVVDSNYRGQKIGERLMDKLIEVAKALNLKDLNLSSGNNPDRSAAHKLYLKLGFEKRDSTLFRKKL